MDDKNKVSDNELLLTDDIIDENTNNIDEINLIKPSIDKNRQERRSKNYYDDDAEKKSIAEHRKRDKIKSVKNKRVFRFVWIAMVLILGISLSSYLIVGSNDLFAIGRADSTADISIPEDVTLDELCDILIDAGAVRSEDFFKLYFTVTSKIESIVSGDRQIQTNMDYEGLISLLQKALPRETVYIIMPEGLTVHEIAELLETNGVCDKEEFIERCEKGNFDKYDMISEITNDVDRYYNVEGYLYPDGYDFYIDEDVDNVIGKLLHNFQLSITKTMMRDIEESGYSLDEIIKIASIIQAEAANETDMHRVSAVIHNRLERGEQYGISSLQMDSTMFYPYNTKEDAPEEFSSNYNTYNVTGLPAGAICNPGNAAINAALNPDKNYSKMFYFCHDADGNAYYASTIAQHNANLVKAGLR